MNEDSLYIWYVWHGAVGLGALSAEDAECVNPQRLTICTVMSDTQEDVNVARYNIRRDAARRLLNKEFDEYM